MLFFIVIRIQSIKNLTSSTQSLSLHRKTVYVNSNNLYEASIFLNLPSIGRFMASNCPYVDSNYLSVVSSGLYMAWNGINLFPGGLFMFCIAVCTL